MLLIQSIQENNLAKDNDPLSNAFDSLFISQCDLKLDNFPFHDVAVQHGYTIAITV